MTKTFHLADFFSRWHGIARHDLSASHSQTISLSALLARATPDERALWDSMSLDYTAPKGSLALRALIAARYDGLEADEIVCCAGAQEGVACTARALLQPGDHAVIVLPLYQPLEWIVTESADATGVTLDAGSYALDVDRIAAAFRPETRLVLTNFPNSPTGAILDAPTQTALIALCRERGIWLVNDEVYRQTACGRVQQSPPIADVYERGVSINSLSKGFGLPGLRVGWVACRDQALLERITLTKASLSNCITAPSQILAQIALREETYLTERARAIGMTNRGHLDRMMQQHPSVFEADEPANLAFAFPRYRGSDGAVAFATRLAEEWQTLLLPSSLWSSPLGKIPADRLRISLGQNGMRSGLQAMLECLATVDA